MEKRIIKQEKDIRPHVFLFHTDNGPAVWHNKGYSDMPYGLLHHSIRPSSSLNTAHISMRKRLLHDAKQPFPQSHTMSDAHLTRSNLRLSTRHITP